MIPAEPPTNPEMRAKVVFDALEDVLKVAPEPAHKSLRLLALHAMIGKGYWESFRNHIERHGVKL